MIEILTWCAGIYTLVQVVKLVLQLIVFPGERARMKESHYQFWFDNEVRRHSGLEAQKERVSLATDYEITEGKKRLAQKETTDND